MRGCWGAGQEGEKEKDKRQGHKEREWGREEESIVKGPYKALLRVPPT